jgi:hypothetical protein
MAKEWYKVNLTNGAWHEWHFAYAANPTAAAAQARKASGMGGRKMVEACAVDRRTPQQRAAAWAWHIAQAASPDSDSNQYRFANVMKFPITKDLLRARQKHSYWQNYQQHLTREFWVWLSNKKKGG